MTPSSAQTVGSGRCPNNSPTFPELLDDPASQSDQQTQGQPVVTIMILWSAMTRSRNPSKDVFSFSHPQDVALQPGAAVKQDARGRGGGPGNQATPGH